jgi:hypothetical protein
MSKYGYGPTPTHPSERFWSKVRRGAPDECWEWISSHHPLGYGFIFAGPLYDKGVRYVKAHRLSWEMHNGPIPEGLCILHHCDNPPCVNPAHLYAGTRQQNCRDRAVRKRGKEHRQNGEANDNAKLTEMDVRAIIILLKAGRSQIVIAKMFGVNQTHISRIKLRQTWKHLWDE